MKCVYLFLYTTFIYFVDWRMIYYEFVKAGDYERYDQSYLTMWDETCDNTNVGLVCKQFKYVVIILNNCCPCTKS